MKAEMKSMRVVNMVGGGGNDGKRAWNKVSLADPKTLENVQFYCADVYERGGAVKGDTVDVEIDIEQVGQYPRVNVTALKVVTKVS